MTQAPTSFSNDQYAMAKLRLKNMAKTTRNIEARTREPRKIRQEHLVEEELTLTKELDAKMDDLIGDVLSAGLRKGRENMLVDGLRDARGAIQSLLHSVRQERSRKAKESDAAANQSQEDVSAQIAEIECACKKRERACELQAQEAIRKKKGAFSEKMKQLRFDHANELKRVDKEHTEELAHCANSVEDRLRREFDNEHGQLQVESGAEFKKVLARVESECKAQVQEVATEAAHMKQRFTDCEEALRQRTDECKVGQRRCQALKQQVQELRAQLEEAEAIASEERSLQIEARSIATSAQEAASQLDQHHHGELHKLRVAHQEQMDQQRARRQREFDDLHQKIKQTVGKKQAAIVQLREQLAAAEARAQEAEQLLTDLDEGFIGT
jgi:hypothetical protein